MPPLLEITCAFQYSVANRDVNYNMVFATVNAKNIFRG